MGSDEATHFRTATHAPEAVSADPLATPVTPAAPPDPDRPDLPGYEVGRELGRGGMGVVYLARQRGLNRDVAVKVLRGPSVSRAARARFWAEAEVMAEVRHPNVVQVIELGEHAGRPFMAMEYVPGGSLKDRLRAEARLPPAAAARLLAQVARGVAAAHDLGIVHRDLKPGNVLMDGDVPKVADFGVAKRRAHDLTQTNDMMGTPAYMAPELAASRAKYVGPAADVWSLGVILYECLAGRRPFAGASVFELLAKIAVEDPPPLPAGVPRDLQTIVAKCLSRAPEQRYPTAAELADDLDRFGRGEPISARPVGLAERAARWVRRNPTAAAAYGLSAVAVTLAGVVFVVFGFYRAAEAARGDAERTRDRLAMLEYGGAVRLAHQAWKDDDPAAARSILDGTDSKLRGWEWHYVDHLCRPELLALAGHDDEVRSAAFDPAGTRIVTAGGDGTARVWDAATGAEVHTLRGHRGWVGSAAFSPDGTRVVTTGEQDGAVRIWDAATGKERLHLPDHRGGVRAVAFSPDGRWLATAGWDSPARLWNAATGAIVRPIHGHPREVRAVAFSPDGRWVVTAGADGVVRVCDAATGEHRGSLVGHTNWVEAVAFSPDGRRVVTAAADRTARVWDFDTRAEVFVLQGHAPRANSAAFSPDGGRVVTAGEDGTVRMWDAATGARVFILRGHAGGVRTAAFSPGGGRVVTAGADRTVRVWDAVADGRMVPSGQSPAAGPLVGAGRVAAAPAGGWQVTTADRPAAGPPALRPHSGDVQAAAFSPDGKRVVTAGSDGNVRVWDAATGAELLTLRGPAGGAAEVGFGPDGRRIVATAGGGTARVWDTHPAADAPPPARR